jgi:phosphorylase kinase alpha/beta subunit
VSLTIEERNALARPGEEAEWCLFDPLISIICGEEFARTRRPEWKDRQTHHFNRSLGHLTAERGAFPGLRCPELYYREDGAWMPSDATPLLWTQALLECALRSIQASAVASERKKRGP